MSHCRSETDESKGHKFRRTIYLNNESLKLMRQVMDDGPVFKFNGNPWTK